MCIYRNTYIHTHTHKDSNRKGRRMKSHYIKPLNQNKIYTDLRTNSQNWTYFTTFFCSQVWELPKSQKLICWIFAGLSLDNSSWRIPVPSYGSWQSLSLQFQTGLQIPKPGTLSDRKNLRLVFLLHFKRLEKTGEQRIARYGTGWKTGTDCKIRGHDRNKLCSHESFGKKRKKQTKKPH